MMIDLLIYIAQSALVLLLFYLFYQLIFRKVKWLAFNRIYLIVGLLLSLLLPVHNGISVLFPTDPLSFHFDQDWIVYPMEAVGADIPVERPVLKPDQLFFGGYLLICLVLAAFFIFRIYRLIYFCNNSKEEKIASSLNLTAYSFLKHIYIDPQVKPGATYDLIYRHEKAHADQWHSLDLLLIEIYKIALWLNPVIWFYTRLIRENHEFLADQSVLEAYPQYRVQYQQQLLNMRLGLITGLRNQFNYPHFKNRINMMNKRSLNAWQKSVFASLFAFVLVFTVACEGLLDLKASADNKKVFNLNQLDQKPLEGEMEKMFYEHVQKKVIYPKIARINGVEGDFYVSFILNKSGKIRDISVSTDQADDQSLMKEIVVVGYTNLPEKKPVDQQVQSTAEAAIKQSLTTIFEEINMNLAPGLKGQQSVETHLVLPLKFRLN